MSVTLIANANNEGQLVIEGGQFQALLSVLSSHLSSANDTDSSEKCEEVSAILLAGSARFPITCQADRRRQSACLLGSREVLAACRIPASTTLPLQAVASAAELAFVVLSSYVIPLHAISSAFTNKAVAQDARDASQFRIPRTTPGQPTAGDSNTYQQPALSTADSSNLAVTDESDFACPPKRVKPASEGLVKASSELAAPQPSAETECTPSGPGVSKADISAQGFSASVPVRPGKSDACTNTCSLLQSKRRRTNTDQSRANSEQSTPTKQQPAESDARPADVPAISTPTRPADRRAEASTSPTGSGDLAAQSMRAAVDDGSEWIELPPRDISCKTYCKRLHVTQDMASLLLPLAVEAAAEGAAGGRANFLFKDRVVVVDEQGSEHSVTYEGFMSAAQKHYRLSSGWSAVVKANNIEVGDKVVFSRRKDNRHRIYLKVIRPNAQPTPQPSQPPHAAGRDLVVDYARWLSSFQTSAMPTCAMPCTPMAAGMAQQQQQPPLQHHQQQQHQQQQQQQQQQQAMSMCGMLPNHHAAPQMFMPTTSHQSPSSVRPGSTPQAIAWVLQQQHNAAAAATAGLTLSNAANSTSAATTMGVNQSVSTQCHMPWQPHNTTF